MMGPFLFLVLGVLFELTECKMIVHHFGPPPDGYTPGQHWVTQVMNQVPKRNRCQQDTFTDCQALLDAGYKEDGIYTIHPYQNDEKIKVLCDMRNHIGWIVVQRRYNGAVNFNRSLVDYRDGFGSMDGEFWLGNEILHNLTDTEGNWTIRLDLTNEQNKTDHLIETPFHVGLDDYTLFVEHSGIQPTVGSYCRDKLGMEDGSIPDDMITASSHHGDFVPSNARLNLGLWWSAASEQFEDSYLQIAMGSEPVQIEGVITQGSEYDFYVKQYVVQYNTSGTAWLYVDGSSTPEIFIGNTDGDTPVTNIFQQPIQAQYIRIRPISWYRRPVLRIELLGCRDEILEAANNQPFQRDETNCPGLNNEGGWWFNRCSGILGVDRNLNAEYIQPGDTMGPYKRVIRATEWNGSRIAKTEIKIRRQSPPRG